MHAALRAVALERDRLYWARRWGLVSHWSGSDLVDSYGNRTLTNNAGATFTAGKVGNAFTLASASSQSLSRNDEEALQIGTGDFWWAGWVKFTTLAASQALSAKYNGGANRRSWQVRYERAYSAGANPAQRIAAYVSSDGSYSEGTTGLYLADTVLGQPSTGTWYFVLFWYDSINKTVNLKCNNGTTVSASWTAGIYNNTADPFYLGRTSDASTLLNGQLDEACFGKQPPVGMPIAAAEISARLYNGGNGLAFPWN